MKHVAEEQNMSTNHVQPAVLNGSALPFLPSELPLTVREAAVYLGVSIQTLYLWVERKQIPHLRVMGRNIRFLRADLESFRATFKCEVGDGETEET
jgi:excisionase family DNA binding protein